MGFALNGIKKIVNMPTIFTPDENSFTGIVNKYMMAEFTDKAHHLFAVVFTLFALVL